MLTLRDAQLLRPDGTLEAGTVVVRHGRIATIGAEPDEPGVVLDCAGLVVSPGLIDAHVHLSVAGSGAFDARNTAQAALRAASNASRLLAAGVTTARDVGGVDGVLKELAQAVARGWLDGPSLVFANQIVCASGGHGTELGIGAQGDGPDEVRRAVRQQIRAGASVIKVAINAADGVELTEHELAAAVDEAHRRNRRIACHASTAAAVDLAVRCGVDTVEHGNGLTEEHARLMAAEGITLVPTVHVFQALWAKLQRDDLGSVPASLAEVLELALRERISDHERSLPLARAAGVRIAVGTDSTPGMQVDTVVDEMLGLHGLGWSSEEVLRAATVDGARALGLDDRGVLREGARADLIVLDGNPVQDLELLRAPRHVVVGGRVVRAWHCTL